MDSYTHSLDVMNKKVTTIAHRYHTKSMFFFVAWVMIFLRLLLAKITRERICWSHFSRFNGIFNTVLGFNFFLVVFAIFSRTFSSIWTFLEFAALFAVRRFAFFCASVFLISYSFALFASRMKTVFPRLVLVKCTNWLIFLAFIASFCFNWFRHGFFLIKKLCLEPLESQSLCGSLYYISLFGGVK